MGLFGGLLGWDAADERLADSRRAIQEAGIKVTIEIAPIGADHPSTYKMTVANFRETHTLTAVSTGGGSIEVTGIDGFSVSMRGDCCETLIYFESDADRLLAHVNEIIRADEIHIMRGEAVRVIEIKSQEFLSPDKVSELCSKFGIRSIKQIRPVLPVLSRRDMKVPFITCDEMLAYNRDQNLDLWELAVRYERSRGALTDDQVMKKMADVIGIMRDAVRAGLAGTENADRILGCQSGFYRSHLENGRLIDAGVLNRVVLYTTALMESKSAMGLIVAAPTAGACGGLPGACLGVADALGLEKDEVTRSMLSGGMIGVFIAAHATFAAEVGGCQAECGAGSGMAAAALVALMGGTTQQAVNAASLALQNILGMVCDPVANRVEVPCLGKNVMAASNALACANMALAGYDPVIPLDEVIQAMDDVGKRIPSELRCTARAGLSTTKTSKEIETRLARKDR
jgi:L-serine dehydratase